MHEILQLVNQTKPLPSPLEALIVRVRVYIYYALLAVQTRRGWNFSFVLDTIKPD